MAELRGRSLAGAGRPRLHGESPPNSISAGRVGGRGTYQFTLQGSDHTELYRSAPILEDNECAKLPGIVDVKQRLRLNNPQIEISMDRDKIAATV